MGNPSGIRRHQDRAKRVLAGHPSQIPQRQVSAAALVTRNAVLTESYPNQNYPKEQTSSLSVFSLALDIDSGCIASGNKKGALNGVPIPAALPRNRSSVAVSCSASTLLHSRASARDGGSAACAVRRR